MPDSIAGHQRLSLLRSSLCFGKQDVDGRDISAFTRVHSPSKTGVNALMDALCPAMTMWRCMPIDAATVEWLRRPAVAGLQQGAQRPERGEVGDAVDLRRPEMALERHD